MIFILHHDFLTLTQVLFSLPLFKGLSTQTPKLSFLIKNKGPLDINYETKKLN